MCLCVSADNDAVCVCVRFMCATRWGARVSNKQAALLIRPALRIRTDIAHTPPLPPRPLTPVKQNRAN